MEKNETFNYTYCAMQQEEIKAIRQKYEAKEKTEDKMAQLRRLDAAVTQKATSIALALGIIGALIMGSGMSLVMTEIGEMIGLQPAVSIFLGIFIGLIGIVLVCIAYPTYNRVVKRQREKIAPEIIRLSDELLQ